MNKMRLIGVILVVAFPAAQQSSVAQDIQKPMHISNAEQVVVYHEEGKFAGWPANNGAWIFNGNDILVGFTQGGYKVQRGHNIDKPFVSMLAFSQDGGKTWQAHDPENFVGDLGDRPELKKLEKRIDFENKNFAMRVVGTAYHGAKDPRGHFFYTYDAGKSWEGPFGFGRLARHPELRKYGLNELTPRTDYVVMGKHEALLMLSARKKRQFGTDRLFCARTTDGGRSFQFHGWIVPPFGEKSDTSSSVELYTDKKNPHPHECRAVMSQTFMLESGKLLTVMRRKYGRGKENERNWVDAYASVDGGKTWAFQAKVGEAGGANGNPPALALLDDGRFAAVFGERKNGTIQVAYSSDEGLTWSDPQILFDAFWSEDMELNDLGYPRLVRRSDGKMVAVFYYSTKEALHHIHATVWKP